MLDQEKHMIAESSDGLRLDKVMATVLPGTGLRLRRRLCDDGKVSIDGKARRPGYKVRAGQEMVITRESDFMTFREMGLKVLEQTDNFAAVYKPGRVHSASVAGSDSDCVEDVLPAMFEEKPFLLNRLDYLTSGILLVALGDGSRQIFQHLEEGGEIKKFYLAEIQGRLDGVITVKNELDTANRKTTKVLEENDVDEQRWTDVETLSHDHDADTSMVRCLILKGARHQIRAHLASIGHPIVGDPVYGAGVEGDALHLHHQRVDFPGFSAQVDAPWDSE